MEPTPHGQEPVVTVIARRVRPGSEAGFEAWLERIIACARRFEGHEGVTVLRPRGPGQPDYLLVVRFASDAALRRWLESEERARYLDEVEPLVTGPMDVRTATGLETWFELPELPGHRPPPRHRMALLTWAAIYPTILALSLVLFPILEPLPSPARFLVITGVLVVLMTWVVMPLMTRVFWRWLHR